MELPSVSGCVVSCEPKTTSPRSKCGRGTFTVFRTLFPANNITVILGSDTSEMVLSGLAMSWLRDP